MTDESSGGKEQPSISTITVSELAEKSAKGYPRGWSEEMKKTLGIKEDFELPPFQNTPLIGLNDERDPQNPQLYIWYEPPLWNRWDFIRLFSFGVNNPETGKITQATGEKRPKKEPRGFRVYDVGVDKLIDPKFVGEINEVNLNGALVTKDKSEADKIGSWIADPSLRELINQYAKFDVTNPGSEGWNKYIELRKSNLDELKKWSRGTITEEDLEWHRQFTAKKNKEQGTH